MKRRLFAALAAAALLSGCSTAGPFITAIEPAGGDTVMVRTAKVYYSPFRWFFFSGVTLVDEQAKLVKLGDLGSVRR